MRFNLIQVRVIAILEIIVSALMLFFVSISVITIIAYNDELLEQLHDAPPVIRNILSFDAPQQVGFFLIPLVYWIVELGLAIFLLHVANKLQYKRLRLWSTVTKTLVLVGVLFAVTNYLLYQGFTDVIGIQIMKITFTIYSIWAVENLMDEIKQGSVQQSVNTTNNPGFNYYPDEKSMMTTQNDQPFHNI